MPILPDNPYASALIERGVDLDVVDVEWDDDCQHDVFTFSCATLPRSVLKQLAQFYLTVPSRFVFVGDLQKAFLGEVRQIPDMRKAEKGLQRYRDDLLLSRGLSNFDPFNASQETLEAFAKRAEYACGFDHQEGLRVSDDGALLLHTGVAGSVGDRIALLYLIQYAAPQHGLLLITESHGG